jgi:uracil phosphoribosyltransferase
MQVYNFINHYSLYSKFLSEIRDQIIQKNPMRFRRNLERLGELSAYEISKQLNFKKLNVVTSLGNAQMDVIDEPIVLATILRAGLPLHQGLLNYFDSAENCFISAYRKHTSKEGFEVEIEYLSSPDLNGKTVFLSDPMLATGKSMVLAYKALLKNGIPNKIHIVSVIGSNQGVDYVKSNFPSNTSLWIGAVDSHMTNESYIVPGLGDAGDLSFGSKLGL